MALYFEISQNHQLAFKIKWDIKVDLNQWSLDCAPGSPGDSYLVCPGGWGCRDWLEKDQESKTQNPPQPQTSITKWNSTSSFFIRGFHMFLFEESIKKIRNKHLLLKIFDVGMIARVPLPPYPLPPSIPPSPPPLSVSMGYVYMFFNNVFKVD